ncbi:MAG: lasso peptide biosynthesis B2 protein [Allosphingosinicella sp.]
MSATLPARRRRARLRFSDWLLLAEALAALAVASAAIHFLAFRRLAAAASRGEAGIVPDEARLRKLRWAVQAWAKRVPWRAVCFQRGLAFHWMLRRRGIASRLHYGVSPTGERGISAHVWISVGDRDWMGGEEASRFKCLAIFPAASGQA